MKILVNAITSKIGGFRTLINSFIESIDENDGNEYYFWVYEGSVECIKKKNIFIEESTLGDMNHIKRFFWYQFKLPFLVKKNNFKYMINLTNYGPLYPRCKEVLLLHNAKHVSKEIKKNYSIKDKMKLFIEDCILRISLRGTYKLIVQTNYMKEGMIKKFNYPKEDIEVIPNSPRKIDMSEINSNLEEELKGFIGNETNIASTITLYFPYKNIELLLGAVKYIKDNNLIKFKLLLTIDKNEGKLAENCLSLIDKYDISDYVMSVGHIENRYIHQVLEKSSIFIFPSYVESLGIPFIEAMRFGLPIIGSDLGFAHDVCNNSALYFQYDNQKELVNRIVQLFTTRELLENLSNNSKARSKLFKEEEAIKRYLELLI